MALPSQAPCGLTTQPTGIGVPSLDGWANRMCEWDPDGAGPLGPRLVVSGAFALAGDQPANSIATFDPATGQWSPLGQLDVQVSALVALPGGLLVASGFLSSTGQLGSTLFVWNGSAWSSAIPQPLVWSTLALAVSPIGELYAACVSDNGMEVQILGSNGWQILGTASPATPTMAASIDCLAFAGNGDLLVGGQFSAIESVAANSVARWNGSAWSPLGSGLIGRVRSLATTSTGALFAGGSFNLGGAPTNDNVAQWNGSSWQSLGSGVQNTTWPQSTVVFALAEVASGLVAAGQFDVAGGVPALELARWNGTAWTTMASGIEPAVGSAVSALQRTSNGELFAAGDFSRIGGRDGIGLGRWNGSFWAPLRAVGIGGATTAVHRSDSGDVYLGGTFQDIDAVACNGIARRVGAGWQPVGAGFAPLDSGLEIAAIRSLPGGDVVAGGWFDGGGGPTTRSLARWNGSVWSSLGAGLATAGLSRPWVRSLHVAANGDLYVAGQFDSAGGLAVDSVARWNGSQWSAVGSGLGPAVLSAVASSPTGEVYIAGQFVSAASFQDGQIAVLSGGGWQGIGVADGPVRELIVLPSGALLVAGSFQSIDGIAVGCVARWSSGAWSSVGALGLASGTDTVRRVRELPGGDLLAAGQFEQNGILYAFARWNGVAWSLLDAEGRTVLDCAVDPNGAVLVAGAFGSVGGVASANFMTLAAPCAASAIASGAGCTGSGGANVLASSGQPWLGTVFVANASGMPSNGVAASVLGLGTLSLPLPSLLPQGGAGCELLVTPDALGLVVPSGGQALLPIALPVLPALVGGVLHLQVVPIEFGLGGAITSVTSTNRLSLTLGIF